MQPKNNPKADNQADNQEKAQPTQVLAYLGLGGNLEGNWCGNAVEDSAPDTPGTLGNYLCQVITLLLQHPALQLVQSSAVYRTKPFGSIAQPDFWNFCLKLQVDEQILARDLSTGDPQSAIAREQLAQVLLNYCLHCEQQLGRNRGVPSIRWGPRRIDIDLLDYDRIQCQSPSLQLPHPGLPQRLFVLVPLAEIADKKFQQDYALERHIQGLVRLAENRDWGQKIAAPPIRN